MKGHIIRLVLPVILLTAFTLHTDFLSAQCLSGNCRNGQGAFRFTNGDEYSGLWTNGQPHGKGVYKFATGERYDGNFTKGKFDGQGTMHYADGGRYTGGWKENKKHGAGTLVDAAGKTTRGNWEMGKYAGQTPANNGAVAGNNANKPKPNTPAPAANKPQQQKPSSSTAQTEKPVDKNQVGNLRNCGKIYCNSGKGYFDYPDGSRWIGEFKDGKPYGKGVCHYANGDRYEGLWAANAPNGDGIMYFASGRVYGAVWVNGAPVRELDSDENVPNDPVKIETTSNVKIWAVIVGIGRYKSMPSLKFTDDDAFRFYSFLKSPEGGALSDEQMTILVDEDATRDNILRTMRTTFLKADANDVVLFYYSGHGLEGCFLPVDYDGYNNKLRHDEIKQLLKESKAKHKLCIADACHSGSLTLSEGLAAKGPAPVSLSRYYQAFEDADGGIALLMSSKSEELSLEDHGLRQGVFTYYLLQGLKGKADANSDQLVTIREIYTFVYTKVREYTAGVQSPVLTGTFDDAMPVALKRY